MSILFTIALAVAAPAQSTPTPTPSATPVATTGYSTAATPVGKLIADPAAQAILEKHLPGISANPQLQAVIDLPLKSIQPYAPTKLTDEKLAAIDVELAALPKK